MKVAVGWEGLWGGVGALAVEAEVVTWAVAAMAVAVKAAVVAAVALKVAAMATEMVEEVTVVARVAPLVAAEAVEVLEVEVVAVAMAAAATALDRHWPTAVRLLARCSLCSAAARRRRGKAAGEEARGS